MDARAPVIHAHQHAREQADHRRRRRRDRLLPTFFSILSAWLHAKRRRAKFVVEVRDLWPGIFVELGVLTNRTIIRLLEGLELVAYRAADLVVVVSEGFRDHIAARGIPSEKIHTVRNGVDLERFSVVSPSSGIRRQLGAEDGSP